MKKLILIVTCIFVLRASAQHITASELNTIIYVDGQQFPNVASALTALPAIGGTVVIPPHYRETFTSTIQVGSGAVGGSPVTNSVTLQLMSDVLLTCNVTGGNPCFKVGSGSTITGTTQGFGAVGTLGANGGSSIYIPSTANISSVIIPLFTNGTIQSISVSGITISASTAATVSGAAIDLQGAADGSFINNNVIIQFPGILLRVKGNSGVSGPCCGIKITNNWLDAGATSGGMTTCQPVVIQGSGVASGAVEGITFDTNSITNSCSTLPLITIDGLGQTNVRDIMFYNTHVERDVANTANWIRIRDAQNIVFDGLESTDAGSGSSDLFNLSQSAANLERAIHIRDMQCISSTTNCINNTIDSITYTTGTYGQFFPEFRFTSSGAYYLHQYSSGNGYVTMANTDFNPGLRLFDTTGSSTNSPNFQLCDNTPTCWNIRKNGTPLAFIAPSGGTLSIPDNASSFNLTETIASGTAAMPTSSIAAVSGTTITCVAAAGNPFTATGVATTDAIIFTPNASPSNPNGGLIVQAWPTSGAVNFEYCNPTASALTPAAETLNWRVVR